MRRNIRGLAATGVRLRVKEMEISAALWVHVVQVVLYSLSLFTLALTWNNSGNWKSRLVKNQKYLQYSTWRSWLYKAEYKLDTGQVVRSALSGQSTVPCHSCWSLNSVEPYVNMDPSVHESLHTRKWFHATYLLKIKYLTDLPRNAFKSVWWHGFERISWQIGNR